MEFCIETHQINTGGNGLAQFGPNLKRFSQLMIVKPDYMCTRHDMITKYLLMCDVCWHFLSLIVLSLLLVIKELYTNRLYVLSNSITSQTYWTSIQLLFERNHGWSNKLLSQAFSIISNFISKSKLRYTYKNKRSRLYSGLQLTTHKNFLHVFRILVLFVKSNRNIWIFFICNFILLFFLLLKIG